MADRITFSVDHRQSAAIMRSFDSLTKASTRTRIARKANTKAIRPETQAAKRNMRAVSRRIARAMISVTYTWKSKGMVVSQVGLDKEKLIDEKGVPYPSNVDALIEYGTAPHDITPKKKRALSDGDSFFGRAVNHPGTKANPVLRPAFDSTVNQQIEIHGREMGAGIAAEFAKGLKK